MRRVIVTACVALGATGTFVMGVPGGPVAAAPTAETVELEVTGRAGIPVDAEAVVMNVTVTNTEAAGFVTIWPCGYPMPEASNLNFVAGTDVANLVVSRVGVRGRVCLRASAATNLIADVAGYFPNGSSFEPTPTPTRILDTRNGTGAPVGEVAADGTVRLQVGGRGGVPSGATAVAMNVTAAGTRGPGFVTAFPCDRPRPVASNLNHGTGQDIANMVVARLAADGSVCLFSSAGTHLIADVTGHFPAGAGLVTIAEPTRVLDTRSGIGRPKGVVAADDTVTVRLADNGVPADVESVVVNVTAVGPLAAGFATVHACDQPRPDASNLNYAAGRDVPNLVFAAPAADGSICIYTKEAAHLLVDVTGWFPPGAGYVALPAPVRILDTRVIAAIDQVTSGLVRVLDGTGAPVTDAGLMICRVGQPGVCVDGSFAPPIGDGSVSVPVDVTASYRLTAYNNRASWPCPDFVSDAGQVFHFSDEITVTGQDLASGARTITLRAPTVYECVEVVVTDDGGTPLRDAGLIICELVGGTCGANRFENIDADGVIRFAVDPTATYQFNAYVKRPDWPCPYVHTDGTPFHFSPLQTKPGTDFVPRQTLVITVPDPGSC